MQTLLRADACARLAAAHNRSLAEGYNYDTTGNATVFLPDEILVTPTDEECVTANNIVGIPYDYKGERLVGNFQPTSEYPLYLRLKVGAAVHWHSPWATAAACRLEPIPCFHYLVPLIGGDCIPCTPYLTAGGDELGEVIATTLGTQYKACLMGKHGMIAVGETLEAAYKMALHVERIAQIYLLAGKRGRRSLPRVEIDRMLDKIAKRRAK